MLPLPKDIKAARGPIGSVRDFLLRDHFTGDCQRCSRVGIRRSNAKVFDGW